MVTLQIALSNLWISFQLLETLHSWIISTFCILN